MKGTKIDVELERMDERHLKFYLNIFVCPDGVVLSVHLHH